MPRHKWPAAFRALQAKGADFATGDSTGDLIGNGGHVEVLCSFEAEELLARLGHDRAERAARDPWPTRVRERAVARSRRDPAVVDAFDLAFQRYAAEAKARQALEEPS